MGNTTANVITAFAAVLTAVGGIVAAFTLLIPILRQTREVHKIVNQQRTDELQYRKALIVALKEAGIDVPVNQAELE